MTSHTIQLGPPLIVFRDLNHWADTAVRAFKTCGVPSVDTVCIDASGRICKRGLHFMVATWPVTVYAVADVEHKEAPHGSSEQA